MVDELLVLLFLGLVTNLGAFELGFQGDVLLLEGEEGGGGVLGGGVDVLVEGRLMLVGFARCKVGFRRFHPTPLPVLFSFHLPLPSLLFLFSSLPSFLLPDPILQKQLIKIVLQTL